MKILIDTHFLLWSVLDSSKISTKEKEILLDVKENDIFVSPISFFEISLKYSIKSLDLKGVSPDDFPSLCTKIGFEILDIPPEDFATFHQLPKRKHSDPFDRMLIWQAIRNGYSLLSRDSDFSQYKENGLKLIKK